MPSADIGIPDLAIALAVSDTELASWCDRGQLLWTITRAGQRRVRFAEAVRFIRREHLLVADVAAMGLDPAHDPAIGRRTETAAVYEAMVAVDERALSDILLIWLLHGRSLAEIFDGPVRGALEQIGCFWESEPIRGVGVEHRASDVCMRALATIEPILEPVAADAPPCCGGSLEGDQHGIASAMVALVLADAGYRVINFGPNTPIEVLLATAGEQHAKGVWLSVTSRTTPDTVLGDQLNVLSRSLRAIGASLFLGGQRLYEQPQLIPDQSALLPSMAALHGHALELMPGLRVGRRRRSA